MWNAVLLCLIGTPLIDFGVSGVFGAVALLGAGSEGSTSGYQLVYSNGSRHFLSVPAIGVIAGTNYMKADIKEYSQPGFMQSLVYHGDVSSWCSVKGQ